MNYSEHQQFDRELQKLGRINLLIDSLKKKQLSSVQVAHVVHDLKLTNHYSNDRISKEIGISSPMVSEYLTLFEMNMKDANVTSINQTRSICRPFNYLATIENLSDFMSKHNDLELPISHVIAARKLYNKLGKLLGY